MPSLKNSVAPDQLVSGELLVKPADLDPYCFQPHNPIKPTHIFPLKMMSAFNVCCIYSNALQTRYVDGSKQCEP